MKKMDKKAEARIASKTTAYLKQMIAAEKSGRSFMDVVDAKGAAAIKRIAKSAVSSEALPSAVRTIPTVTEIEGGRERGYDLFSLIMKERILMLEGPVDETMASIACASLHYMDKNKPGEKITAYIDSPGGSVLAGLAIYDTMRSISCPITTIGVGMQASMGSIMLASGDERYMTENSKLMIHQISGGQQGQASDMTLSHAFSQDLHEDLKSIYVRHIGLKHEFWDLALERDTWLTAQQALKMGFIHGIAEVKRKAPFEEDALRGAFERAKAPKMPDTAEGIVSILNNTSANRGYSGEMRGELVTALSQFPEYWTEGKKRMEAQKAAKAAPANDDRKKQSLAPALKRQTP